MELLSRIRAFFRSRRLDAEIDDEIHSHLALLEADNIRRGMDPQQAHRAALVTLGNPISLREAHREARGLPFLDSLLQDLKYAARSLRKTPGFLIAAILTLGIGIGANTAVFSTIDETLFRPLDFPKPEQLADVYAWNKATATFLSSSYPDYEDLRARTATFQQLAAFVRMPMNVAFAGNVAPGNAGQPTERLPVEAVTGNYFSMLEMAPAAGRAFRNDDDSAAGSGVAMLSEEIADARSLGARILIEDQPFTVIGIVPKRYHGTNLNWGDAPRVWIPLHATALVQPRFRAIDIFHRRSAQWLLITGRLNPGFSARQAQSEMQTIASGIAQRAPATNRDMSALVFNASRSKFWPSYRASISQSLMAFAVAAALVLLLTCANLSNLLLSRATARHREFAIRLSMGAARGRLVRQLFTECTLLSLPGCAAALVIAFGLSRVLAHFPNALGLPMALDGGTDVRVLGFCIALSAVATVLFGLIPALQSTRADVLPALKESGNTLSGGDHNRLRNFFLVLQVSFTMILLVGGGLFGRSVMRAWSIDPGFSSEGLLTATFSAPATGSDPVARFRRAQQALTERLRTTPGVQSVSLGSQPPFNNLHPKIPLDTDTASVTADWLTVNADFFKTMGIPLLSGRPFTNLDTETAPKVAIVNQTLAARLWPGASPLGKTVQTQKAAMQVVGVARDSKYNSVWEDTPPSLYVALSQAGGTPGSYLILRAAGAPANIVASISREWSGIILNSPLYNFQTANDLLNLTLAPQRMAAWVFGAFGLIAIVLASVGIYSSVSYAAMRRTREIGIRLAIGAAPSAIMRRILFQSVRVAAAGLVAGTAIGLLLTRFIASRVKGVSVYDTATFVGVAALLGTLALFAAAIPARRAAKLDPQVALRSE